MTKGVPCRAMTIDEAFEACRHRLVVRGIPAPEIEGNLMGLEWGPSDSPDEGTLLGLMRGEWLDVLDLELVHPDDAR